MGNIASGKSSVIDATRTILEGEYGADTRAGAIEFYRKKVHDRAHTTRFTWEMEDQAYDLLQRDAIQASQEGRIFFVETTGLARIMLSFHKLLTYPPSYIEPFKVLLACSGDVCIEREKNRAKNLDEFPLPFVRGKTQDSIIQMVPSFRTLETKSSLNLILFTDCKSVNDNARILARAIAGRCQLL